MFHICGREKHSVKSVVSLLPSTKNPINHKEEMDNPLSEISRLPGINKWKDLNTHRKFYNKTKTGTKNQNI